MFVITLFGLLAFVNAAPHYKHYDPFTSDELGRLERVLDEEIFSMRNFWTQLSKDMLELEHSLQDMSRRVSIDVPEGKIEGNSYIIEMPLPDFKEKDITVQIGNRMLKIEAHNAYFNHYMYMVTLPHNVDETATWEFQNGVLTVTLPLKGDGEAKDEGENKPSEREHSREEIEEDKNDDVTMNADVGLETTKQPELLTNKIPEAEVEATTYSEMNNEIDFVPIRFK